SRIPSPFMAITSPEKIWVRCFSPSRMSWCTSTWSPTVKGVRSFLRCGASTNCISLFFMIVSRYGYACLLYYLLAAGGRLLHPPASNGLVIALEQDFWHRHVPEHTRPGVLRVLQPARDAV